MQRQEDLFGIPRLDSAWVYAASPKLVRPIFAFVNKLYACHGVNDDTAQRSGTSGARYSSYVIHCSLVVSSFQACSGAHEYRWNNCGRVSFVPVPPFPSREYTAIK
ncbi:hypothetical protein VTO73DRAFT_15386 [Trametes versicolor]